MNTSKTFSFNRFNQSTLASYTAPREGEVRLGERITTEITSDTRFAIFGIQEDTGPRANHGNPGSDKAFESFLNKFLNMQSNRYLEGNSIAVLGAITSAPVEGTPEELSPLVEELDQFVISTLHEFNIDDCCVIIIGGGHNNAYPILKTVKGIIDQSLHVINIDPHADCRALDRRHSGNPFTAAMRDNLMSSYTAIGLHEQYNNEFILAQMDEFSNTYRFFEDYLDTPELFLKDIEDFNQRSANKPVGIEIDLDCMTFMPTSAYTPSGFSVELVRMALRRLASNNVRYLHLPEGAPISPEQQTIVGKTLAYLVSDFIKKS